MPNYPCLSMPSTIKGKIDEVLGLIESQLLEYVEWFDGEFKRARIDILSTGAQEGDGLNTLVNQRLDSTDMGREYSSYRHEIPALMTELESI